MKKRILLIISHILFAAIGFVGGIYMLPILTAPDAPTIHRVATLAKQAQFTGQFHRDLSDSDFLHWGEGTLSVGPKFISLVGEIAPGPDYKLYLSPKFVETEADFIKLKSQMIQVGEVRTFENFIIPLPDTIELTEYNTVIIWCESFAQFITAASYR